MSTPLRRFLLTTTTRDAERLCAELGRAGVAAEYVEPKMIRGNDGQFLFPGRAAGLIAAPSTSAQVLQIEQFAGELGIDILTLEMPVSATSELGADRLVRLAQVSDPITAHLMRNILGQHDIEAMVVGDAFDADASLIQGRGGAVGLYVREEDVTAAREFLEKSLEQNAAASPPLESTSEDIEVFAWPQCPQCGERRLAVCPICTTSGIDFPIADNNFSAGEAAAAFACICTICDEPWSPEFPRLCEWCNHDFGTGLEYEAPKSVVEQPEINRRVAVAIVGLCALLGAVALWFMAISPSP